MRAWHSLGFQLRYNTSILLYLTNLNGGYTIVKTKNLTTNVDVAAFAAFGGLTVMPMFLLFMDAHGLRYSIVALVITLWGFYP